METYSILVVNWRDMRHPEAGGSEVHVHNICAEFVKMGHEVYLYSSGFPLAKRTEEIDGIRIIRCGGRLSVYGSVFKQYLHDRSKFDVILESINTFPFFMSVYAKQPVVALVYSINNKRALVKELGITPLSLVGWLGNSLVPLIYRKGVVITISETSKKELVAAGFDYAKVHVANPGVGHHFEELVEKLPESARPNSRIIYVGRLKKYKGIDTLLQAVLLLRDLTDIELLIVGRGDFETQLKQLVIELGLEKHVRFTGFLTEEQKVAALKSSSVFVSCSLDEGGWTISGLEALRCGVPLVLTDSQRDLVQEGLTGFIVPYNHSEVLADKVLAVLKGNWKKMSIAASRWSESYTWKHTAASTLKALRSAMEENDNAPQER